VGSALAFAKPSFVGIAGKIGFVLQNSLFARAPGFFALQSVVGAYTQLAFLSSALSRCENGFSGG
jgi:hypothetical protein